MVSMTQFDSYFEPVTQKLYVAAVSTSLSRAYLYALNANFTYNTTTEVAAIFGTNSHLDLKVAASTSYIFVGSRVSGSQLRLGVYNLDLTLNNSGEFNINEAANIASGTDTDDIFNFDDMKYGSSNRLNYEIIPYSSEARIVAASKPGNDYQIYLARLRLQSNVWKISCGDCEPVSFRSGYVSPFVKLAVSPVSAHNNDTDNSLSSPAGSYLRDVVFMSHAEMDDTISGTPNSADPYLGVLNIQGEAIGATSLPSGTGDVGLFRPPLVKN